MIRAAALSLAAVATPVAAQHTGHTMPPGMTMERPKPKPAPKPAPRPLAKAKPKPAPPAVKPTPRKRPSTPARTKPATPSQSAAEQPSPDHGAMDHGSIGHSMEGGGSPDTGDEPAPDHSSTDHGPMPMPMSSGPAPTVETPSPPAAGSGPARAADAIWGADAMRASREELAQGQGGQSFAFFMADRAEVRVRKGRDGFLWDLQGYYGGDIDKLWVKSEGEGSFGKPLEQAEVQALWSHAIGPFFDAQLGVRQDFDGPDRTHLVAGVQGLAPYLFEIDAAAFLSHRGELTARIEAELDQRITQRLRLQPRAEVNLSAQDVPELGIGAGLDSIEVGLRLRYEIVREFAPYLGVEQEWRTGASRRFARADGEDASVTNFVLGVRFWL